MMSKILIHGGLSDAWSFKFGHVLKVGAAKCLEKKNEIVTWRGGGFLSDFMAPSRFY